MRQSKTRFPALITCLLALLMPAWAYALNLGDIHLKSAPGQPLEAEIPLSGVPADAPGSLSVGLADVAGFRWAGIEWTPALNRLQFELIRGRDGADYIRVHSDESLRAPLLHFLLKVAWSRGRLFREYTLELDTPPHDSAAAPAGDREAAGTTARESRRYEVMRNDTLWEVARELRPDSSVSIQQMMLALLRMNPDAFSHNNINWLRAGQTLWMPSAFEMQALSAAEAFAEVLAQNNVWRQARGLPALETGWLAGAGTISVDGGLRLVPVGEGDLEGDRVAAAEPDGASREQALALANEQVEELSQENIELEDKLAESETIIEDLRRLVELKDDELAALQAQELSEQAEPGPDLAERIGAAYDSATDALSGERVKSMYEGVKDNWQFALTFLAALLALAAWFLLLRNSYRPRKEAAVPAASAGPDSAKVAGDGKTVSPDEDDIQEAGGGAGESDVADVMEEAEPGAMDETVSPDEDDIQEAGGGAEELDVVDDMEEAEPGTLDEVEAEGDGLSDETEAEEEDLSDETEDEEDLVQNKLDLARAYLELGDTENVRAILDEVLSEGNAAQREEARELLEQAKSG